MKISVSSYSFSSLMKTGALTQLGCVSKAKEMGFDAIEIESIHPHDGSSSPEYAKKLREECERLSLTVSNYTFGADLLNGSEGNLDAEIERIKAQIDIANLLGAKSVRHDATIGYTKETRGYRGFDDVLPRLVEGCRRITEYAASKGIRTMVENHGFFCQDSERVEKLVNGVARDNFGLLCDMGNFLCADENPIDAVSRIAPYAFYVHVKDFHVKSGMGPDPGEGFFKSRGGNYLRGAIIGHGDVPVAQCLSILKNVGYNGYVSIEFEGLEDCEKGIAIGLANLRRYLA
ncbi:MAG: sugar phosphate isomerase/epimerase family protein [Fusicatenibacter sp.]|nr:sugar phosphate isomerase/epimerase [Lachnospiraceae bacterium]MDY2938984.1 sugar phosphate isomerase/epimerase family protein [Fusicatenibacter sp.]